MPKYRLLKPSLQRTPQMGEGLHLRGRIGGTTPPIGEQGWLSWELDNNCKFIGRAAGAGIDPMATSCKKRIGEEGIGTLHSLFNLYYNTISQFNRVYCGRVTCLC